MKWVSCAYTVITFIIMGSLFLPVHPRRPSTSLTSSRHHNGRHSLLSDLYPHSSPDSYFSIVCPSSLLSCVFRFCCPFVLSGIMFPFFMLLTAPHLFSLFPSCCSSRLSLSCCSLVRFLSFPPSLFSHPLPQSPHVYPLVYSACPLAQSAQSLPVKPRPHLSATLSFSLETNVNSSVCLSFT